MCLAGTSFLFAVSDYLQRLCRCPCLAGTSFLFAVSDYLQRQLVHLFLAVSGWYFLLANCV
jgi:hypothetical protein